MTRPNELGKMWQNDSVDPDQTALYDQCDLG